jgi:hypothetical protein
MSIESTIAIAFSIGAFGFSLYTLWVVRVSPYRLMVYPPALSYLNRKESSLVLDMTFYNAGRVRVAVLDMEITLWARGQQVMAGCLKPRAFHQTLFPQATLATWHSVIARFTPFLINKDETVSKTVYFCATPREATAPEWRDSDIESIRIAFKINNRWSRKTFSLDYAELQAFQREKQNIALISPPFATSFLPQADPLNLRGSIFDPVY